MIAGIVTAYLVMSAVAFAALGVDKRAATAGRRRIPESTLHALELLGGWPGAILAIRVLRHKSSKARYFVVTWAIAALHGAAWLAAAAV